MAPFPSLPQAATHREERQRRLARTQSRYAYRAPCENQLRPISIARSWHRWNERRSLRWYLQIGRGFGAAWVLRELQLLRFALQKAAFRFDKLRAYRQLLRDPIPRFVEEAEQDEAFAYWRIAGPNPVVLEQERQLEALRLRIPFDTQRSEQGLERRLGRAVRLPAEAEAGRLFAVDFALLQSALRPLPDAAAALRTRDSRWREKYLAAPIGVFLEVPDLAGRSVLLPLAIQIDQRQPGNERNPVYTPDDGWGWRIAKLYFEVADQSFHLGCSHVHRTHLVLGPFCLATPRQLSSEHPVFVLLQPHTRFTLQANEAAYRYFIDRRKTYHEFYAGTLEETREIAIQSHLGKSFLELELETELESRGVQEAPAQYPYRDDARLWLQPIRDFVTAYLEAFYRSDADVQQDVELQAWAVELMDRMDRKRGVVVGLVPDDRLDSVAKLVELLTQVIFTAGPGHAALHFAGNFYHRYAPAFPAAAYAPPPWRGDGVHEARFRNTLPPILPASNQVRYSTFTKLQYDRFGDYEPYPLGRRVPEARGPIARLQSALAEVERTIQERQAQRLLPYEFLLPSRVPNSINI